MKFLFPTLGLIVNTVFYFILGVQTVQLFLCIAWALALGYCIGKHFTDKEYQMTPEEYKVFREAIKKAKALKDKE